MEEVKYIRVYWCGNLKGIYRLEFLDIYMEDDNMKWIVKERDGLVQT